MGNGFRNLRWNFTEKPTPEKRVRFSDDNARILYSSRYLASDLVLSDIVAPIVRLTLSAPPRVGDTTVKVSVTASDDRGLRAALFFSRAQDSVVGGRALTGKSVTFEQTLSVRALAEGTFTLEAFVTDNGGNLTRSEVSAKVAK